MNLPTAKTPQFPSHASPRVWLITSTTTPIGTAIARHALSHGDSVVAGVRDIDLLRGGGGKEGQREAEFWEFWAEVRGKKEWRERCKGVELDGRCEGPFEYRCAG